MRIAALDIGDKRVGVALSDASKRLAMPHDVLDTRTLLADGSVLKTLIDEYEVEHIVVGLPLSLDGKEGPQARHVRALALKILRACGYLEEENAELVSQRVTFYDERLSSVEAKAVLAQEDLTERSMRGKVDKIAASLFLQSYLDAQRVQS